MRQRGKTSRVKIYFKLLSKHPQALTATRAEVGQELEDRWDFSWPPSSHQGLSKSTRIRPSYSGTPGGTMMAARENPAAARLLRPALPVRLPIRHQQRLPSSQACASRGGHGRCPLFPPRSPVMQRATPFRTCTEIIENKPSFQQNKLFPHCQAQSSQ